MFPLNNSEQDPYTHGGLVDRLVNGVLGGKAFLQQGQVKVDRTEGFHRHRGKKESQKTPWKRERAHA